MGNEEEVLKGGEKEAVKICVGKMEKHWGSEDAVRLPHVQGEFVLPRLQGQGHFYERTLFCR